MTDDRSLPFRERADRAYREAVTNVRTVLDLWNRRELEAIEEYREPLSLDTRKEVTVLLSWGGPSDGFRVYFDEEGNAMSGSYFLADWFEYEEHKLTDDELDQVLRLYFPFHGELA